MHYIGNAKLTAELGQWADRKRTAIKNNQPVPPMPEYVGESVMLIADRLMKKQNFAGYTYREDMQSEGVLAAVKYAHNFDGTKSNNGFAYLTQIIRQAAIKTIQEEQEKTYRHMFICETAPCSHPTYGKAQRQLNAEHERYQSWRAALPIKKPKPKKPTFTDEIAKLMIQGITNPVELRRKTGRTKQAVLSAITRARRTHRMPLVAPRTAHNALSAAG